MGPLTSFQSLPFINIYSSSSTKNNILEPREEKKINAKHGELGLKSMCARAARKPAHGSLRARRTPGRAPPGGPRSGLPGGRHRTLSLLQRGALCSPFPPGLPSSGFKRGGRGGRKPNQCERKEGGYF